ILDVAKGAEEMAERWVLHCDCNSFYASVELLTRPELRRKPVAVCGDPASRHGIILAKNEPAKAMGVKTAEAIWQAKRKCPDLALLEPHRERYVHYYKVINEIYCRFTDRVEPFSIDESWLDVTGSWQLFAQSPKALADRLRAEVRGATGLTISVGASFNKVFAKLAATTKSRTPPPLSPGKTSRTSSGRCRPGTCSLWGVRPPKSWRA